MRWLAARVPFLPLALGAALGILLADNFTLIISGGLIPSAVAVLVAAILFAADRVMFRALILFFAGAVLFGAIHAREINRNTRGLPPTRTVALVHGMVESAPRLTPDEDDQQPARFLFRIRQAEIGQRKIEAARGRLIYLSLRQPDDLGRTLRLGDELILRGSLSPLGASRNPSVFDSAEYRWRQGITHQLNVTFPRRDLRIIDTGEAPWYLRASAFLQETIEEALYYQVADEKDAAIISSLVMGGSGGRLPVEAREIFRHTGTLHLFAVSGLHVGMVAAIVFVVFSAFGVNRRQLVCAIAAVLFLYCLVAGFRPSVVRASLMLSIVAWGYSLGRGPHVLNSWAAAMVMILLLDTQQLFATGFQLSFTVVFGLIIGTAPLYRFLARLYLPDPFIPRRLWTGRHRLTTCAGNYLNGLFSTSFVAGLFSFPIILWQFNLLTPLSVLPNMVAVPLAFGCMILAMGSILVFPALPVVAAGLNAANSAILGIILSVLTFFESLPFTHQYQDPDRLFAKREPAARMIIFALPGEEAAMFLQTDRGKKVLIDCGRPESVSRIIAPALLSYGLSEVDYLFATHGDADQLAGAVRAMEEFSIERVFINAIDRRSATMRELTAYLEKHPSVESELFHADREELRLSDRVTFKAIHPPANPDFRFGDDAAMVLQMRIEDWRVLFMSDNGLRTETEFLQKEGVPRCELLISTGHASDPSGSTEFIRATQAKVVIGSGHGLTTDEHGAMIIEFFPEEIIGRGHASGTVFRLTR